LVAAEKQNLDAAKPSGDATQSLVSTTDEVYYRIKAMYVWWMLREMIGDDALQTVIQNYHADQDKDPTYVQRLISAQSKRDLEWFFDDWVYRDRGLPDFKVASAVSRETLNNAYVVAVTVENAGAAGAELPVTIDSTNGQKTARLLVKAGQKEITRISVTGKPIQVILGDGSVPESDTSNNRIDVK
jgi:aminopeptidase N